MLKRIIISAVMVVVCVPLQGMKVTLQGDDEFPRKYSVMHHMIDKVQEEPVEMSISRYKEYTLSNDTTLEMHLKPNDVVEISNAREPNTPRTLLAKLIATDAMDNGVISVSEKGCAIMSGQGTQK